MKLETVLSTGSPRGAVKPPILRTRTGFGHRPQDYGGLMAALFADVSQRVDGLVVQQNLEVEVRPRGPPRVAHAGDDLAAAHRVADGHEIVDVVRVARHVAVPMVDLDELAVAVALPQPDHDTRRDRDDLGAFAAGEIDALVERAAAG